MHAMSTLPTSRSAQILGRAAVQECGCTGWLRDTTGENCTSRGAKLCPSRSWLMGPSPAAVSSDTTSAWMTSTSAASPCRRRLLSTAMCRVMHINDVGSHMDLSRSSHRIQGCVLCCICTSGLRGSTSEGFNQASGIRLRPSQSQHSPLNTGTEKHPAPWHRAARRCAPPARGAPPVHSLLPPPPWCRTTPATQRASAHQQHVTSVDMTLCSTE
jgi:hypothetical protein